MGQKVHPSSFRLGQKLINTWGFYSYVGKSSHKDTLQMKLKLKDYFLSSFKGNVSNVNIRLSTTKVIIDVLCKKPGLIIGSSGSGIEKIKSELSNLTNNSYEVSINVNEIKEQNLDANLVASSIATQLEKRSSFRKLMKRAVQLAMKSGAKGIKVYCSGRLSGADIARTEKYIEGTVPLHTLRAKIDYALAEAKTVYGIIGVKVWIHLPEKQVVRKKTFSELHQKKNLKKAN